MKLIRSHYTAAIILALGIFSIGSAHAQAQSNTGVFNPRDYGATCNASGTGDDNGITAAITALQNAGGGALLIPGKCVVTAPKQITGVPASLIGTGIGVSQIIANGSYGPAGSFLFTIDLRGNSENSAYVHNVGLRTYQQEQVNGLKIIAQPSGLEDRANIDTLEIRGANVGAHGFQYGLQLQDIAGVKVSKTTVTGRQSGTGPANLTNMNVCFDIPNTTGTQTNYGFSDVRCNAAKIGWNLQGYVEGVLCTRCFGIAVGTGFNTNPQAIVPLINIAQSHFDFYDNGVVLRQFSQSSFTANLLYHRSDATPGSTGTCYYFQGANGGGKTNDINGGGCFESGQPGNANTVGVVLDNARNTTISGWALDGLKIGVNNVNGTTGTIYRKGQWINPVAGGGEFGNGGQNSNLCFGYGGTASNYCP